MNRLQRGITLFETLVCCVIVAVLASLLMSVFTGAKASAKRTVSASNLQQIHKAMLMYRDDWGDYPSTLSVQDPNTKKISNPHYEYFVSRYLGGVRFSAPEMVSPKQEQGQIFPGYLIRGGFNDDLKIPSHVVSQACREKRGGEDPLAYDMNTAYAKIAQAHGERYWLVVREQGNVQKLNFTHVFNFNNQRDTWPCPKGTRLDNL